MREREREQQCKYPWIPLPLGWLNLSLSDFEGFGELLTAQMAAIQQVLSLNEALCRRRKTPHLGHLGRMGWKSYSNTGYIKLQYRCHYTHLYIYILIYICMCIFLLVMHSLVLPSFIFMMFIGLGLDGLMGYRPFASREMRSFAKRNFGIYVVYVYL